MGLHFEDKHFQALFGKAAFAALVVDDVPEIKAFNTCAMALTGYETTHLSGCPLPTLIPESNNAWVSTLLEEDAAPAGEERTTPTCAVLGADGRYRKCEVSVGQFFSGGRRYHLIFLYDQTPVAEKEQAIRALEADMENRIRESSQALHVTVEQLSRQIRENERKDQELLKSLEKEQELNRLKSNFVSVASHEFRTPLSGILASTYLFSKYTKAEDQPLRDKHIKRILTSVKHLNDVMNDFLSVDKIEQGNFKPNLTAFGISSVVNEIIANLQYMLKKDQQISYSNHYEGDIAYLDQTMFQYILTNLLTNAIKYSPEGSRIEIEISHTADQLLLAVQDHGVGIPVAEQQNLYKRFYRGSNVAQFQGTGLGLSIVKKYVDILDGTIECISEENKGTRFIIHFNNQQEINEDHTGS